MKSFLKLHCKEERALAFFLHPSSFSLVSPAPFPWPISKNRRVSAAQFPYYHCLMGMQPQVFMNEPQTTPETQNWKTNRGWTRMDADFWISAAARAARFIREKSQVCGEILRSPADFQLLKSSWSCRYAEIRTLRRCFSRRNRRPTQNLMAQGLEPAKHGVFHDGFREFSHAFSFGCAHGRGAP
jgi:hypothetical protein